MDDREDGRGRPVLESGEQAVDWRRDILHKRALARQRRAALPATLELGRQQRQQRVVPQVLPRAMPVIRCATSVRNAGTLSRGDRGGR